MGVGRAAWMLAVGVLVGYPLVLPVTAAADQVAPPAERRAVSACRAAADEGRRTAQQAQLVNGVVTLGGCVADTSGIDHMLVRYESDEDGRHGRICTDPYVQDGAWSCRWDTRGLPPGAYVVRFVAVDAAGNRGSFERRFAVEAPTAAAVNAPDAGDQAGGDESAVDGRGIEPGSESQLGSMSSDAPAADTTGTSAGAATDMAGDGADGTASDGTGDAGAGAGSEVAEGAALDLSRRLALERVAACAEGGVQGAPTDSVDIVSQVDQAAMVQACLAPALQALGAESVVVDPVPVPPTVRALFADPALRARVGELLPSSVAGVPLQLAAAEHPVDDPGRAGSAEQPGARSQAGT